MLNKRGYIITPLVFITILILTITTITYYNNMDINLMNEIRSIEELQRAHKELDKKLIDQINFMKIATYQCSNDYCYPNKTEQLKSCIISKANEFYNNTNWQINIYNETNNFKLGFKTSEFYSNFSLMSSSPKDIKVILSKEYFKLC